MEDQWGKNSILMVGIYEFKFISSQIEDEFSGSGNNPEKLASPPDTNIAEITGRAGLEIARKVFGFLPGL